MLYPLPSRSAILLALAGVLTAAIPTGARAQAPDTPPPTHCDSTPVGTGSERPAIRLWDDGPAVADWTPPACTGWTEPGFRVLIELAGTLPATTSTALLARIGAVSRLRGLHYWSVSDDAWQVLVTDAAALSSPDPDARRPDFQPDELGPGTTLHFTQTDNRAARAVVYRLRMLELGPDRIVLTVENATDLSKLFLTLAEPGTLQSLHILQRQPDGTWSYRLLSRTGEGVSPLVAGRTDSLINRAAALYRHIAGIPDKAMPPAAP